MSFTHQTSKTFSLNNYLQPSLLDIPHLLNPHTISSAQSIPLHFVASHLAKACRADVYTGTAWPKSDASLSSLATVPVERPAYLCKCLILHCHHGVQCHGAYRLLTSASSTSVFSKGTFPEVSILTLLTLCVTRASIFASTDLHLHPSTLPAASPIYDADSSALGIRSNSV